MFSILKKHKGKVINVNEIDSLIGNIELIDVRERNEYNNGHIKTSVNIPLSELRERINEIPKDRI